LVFLFSGLWHGAAWNFVVWGAYHGFFLVIDKVFWLRISQKLPSIVNTAITFIIVLFGWVLFRAASLSEAVYFSKVMLGLASPTVALDIPSAVLIDNRAIFIMVIAFTLSFVPKFQIEPISVRIPQGAFGLVTKGAAVAILLILSTSFMASRGYTPFLYFRF